MEEEKQEQPERKEIVEMLASSLLSRRAEAMEYRASTGVERRWAEDEELFDFMDDVEHTSMVSRAARTAPVRNALAGRSTVKVNIVRAKTEAAVGRFADIAMPVDDRNWELDATPVPDLDKQLLDTRPAMQGGAPVMDQQTGQQATMRDVAQDIIDQAKDRMSAMQTEIDDQLVECRYNAECRAMLWDAAKLGTGVLKGPMVVKRAKKRWQDMDGMQVLQVSEEHKPASKRVSPWMVWPSPDCGSDLSRAEYFWECDYMLAREIRGLSGIAGYDAEMIELALSTPPNRVSTGYGPDGNRIDRYTVKDSSLYEVWEYNGDVPRDLLDCMRCEIPEEMGGSSLSAAVVFVNDLPIKAALNPLDTVDLPYDFFQWTKTGDSPWGIGIPRMMAWQQRVITAAWRASMDNAGDSAGQQIIMNAGVEPADGVWELSGRKIWRNTDGSVNAAQAFSQFQLQSRQQELANIIELALRFADMETGIPMLFQGEQGKLPETLGATNIMVDANNVSLRTRVRVFDDQITVPHLRRYYDWNMQYNEREDIKGDYQVNARGVSALLKKDQQAQSIIQLWPLLADHDVASRVDKGKLAKQLFAAHRLDVLKTEDQIKQEQEQLQQQGAQPDPATSAAQIRAEAQLQVAQLNQESDMQELQLKQAMADADRAHEREMKQMDLQIQMMKLANDRDISLDSIKAMLASESMKLKTQKELAAGKSAPQIATPPTEPPGRAPEGQAYQR